MDINFRIVFNKILCLFSGSHRKKMVNKFFATMNQHTFEKLTIFNGWSDKPIIKIKPNELFIEEKDMD
jgi:hypothetical protein